MFSIFLTTPSFTYKYSFPLFAKNTFEQTTVNNDIIKVISKYMVIDAEGLDIQITSTESEGDNGSVPAIYANIPIKDMRNSDK